MFGTFRLNGILKSIVLAATLLLVLTLVVASAAPADPEQRVVFNKTASNATPHIGEVFSFTLTFGSAPTETETLQVIVIDPNPAPSYLDIIPDQITGGAEYSSTIDAVVWQGTLDPAVTLPHIVEFQMQVTGIPPSALAGGFVVNNVATMNDLADPGSLPEETAEASIRITALKERLPIILKNLE